VFDLADDVELLDSRPLFALGWPVKNHEAATCRDFHAGFNEKMLHSSSRLAPANKKL
jgi:hypothetical protein